MSISTIFLGLAFYFYYLIPRALFNSRVGFEDVGPLSSPLISFLTFSSIFSLIASLSYTGTSISAMTLGSNGSSCY